MYKHSEWDWILLQFNCGFWKVRQTQYLALLVPAPTRPMAKIALWATSESLSCENLLSVSKILSFGLETDIRPSASGTDLLITGSQYRNWKDTIPSHNLAHSTHSTIGVTISYSSKQSTSYSSFSFTLAIRALPTINWSTRQQSSPYKTPQMSKRGVEV